ncbi:hypothetical protein CIHG_08797 [Coccidioides immitis H538.4]|uniref:Uncharacterized protein n=2 Tax=Coccidioides immitis TaxID=5501 RepID=A0A0J8S281_COCIT|nr:hypothetical protein CIRG_04692 [Coccidioides immitis RMSCC 2394]KMU90941.1 hypothetical protein CIHG_08797 [Coccidioides immitis H538.4]
MTENTSALQSVTRLRRHSREALATHDSHRFLLAFNLWPPVISWNTGYNNSLMSSLRRRQRIAKVDSLQSCLTIIEGSEGLCPTIFPNTSSPSRGRSNDDQNSKRLSTLRLLDVCH